MTHPDEDSPDGQLRGVVFDLDGTLLNTWEIHASCLRRAVKALGAERVSAVRLFHAQRPTDLATLGELVGPHQANAALLAYRSALREVLRTVRPRPVAHAVKVVDGLRHRGVAVGVCTGRSREDAQALLEAGGLDVPLTVARQDALAKPAPDALVLALSRLGLRPHETLFVGDSEWDRGQGRAAGVRTLIIGRAGLPAELGAAVWPTASGDRAQPSDH
ncbi:HAD family hydrolase [Streptosporangium sp. NPDC004631]